VLPGLNLLSIGGVVFAERYLYVPLAGFALFAAWLLERVAVRLPLLRPVVVGALALALVACFVLAADRVGDWSSDERLARSSLEVYPGGSEVWRDLGLAVGREGRHAEALAAFERAVELAPRAPQTWKAYATALVNLGQYEEGARAWRECIERTPGETPPALWRGLGEALLYGARAQVDAGDPAEALRLVGEIEALGHADGEILGAAKEVREVAERLP
jgi:tetratricopeptide (TPR) repeat protein